MKPQLTLYSRKDCCLCEEMKAVIRQVVATTPCDFREIDIDTNHELQTQYNDQVPVLFIDGRKAFKYRVTASQLTNRIARKTANLLTGLTGVLGRRRP